MEWSDAVQECVRLVCGPAQRLGPYAAGFFSSTLCGAAMRSWVQGQYILMQDSGWVLGESGGGGGKRHGTAMC